MCITKEQLFEITSPDPSNLPEYEIEVWYRYVVNGQQEKDFDIHKIKVITLSEAVLKAKQLYSTWKKIPYAFYHNKEKISIGLVDEVRTEKTPFEQMNLTCTEITGRVTSNTTNQKNPDFDKPLSELNSEY